MTLICKNTFYRHLGLGTSMDKNLKKKMDENMKTLKMHKLIRNLNNENKTSIFTYEFRIYAL